MPTEPTEDGRDTAVVLAYVHDTDVSYSWHHSMLELVGWDMAHEGRVMRGGYIGFRYGTDGLVDARNKSAATFLKENMADWLFWVDTDMGFAPDTLDRLMEVADPVERPVVGALCFAQREQRSDGMGGWRCQAVPTIYDWLNTGDQIGFAVRWQYPVDTVIRTGGTGAACVLVHRSVFEKIQEKYGPTWYDRVPNTTTGQVLSEDLAMCLRAGTLGIPVHVHTGVKTTHAKHMWLAEEDYWRQIAADAHEVTSDAPVTSLPVEDAAVIVPVLNRPQNAQPFMDSLRASTDRVTAYAVADGEDEATVNAWKRAGATVVITDSTGRDGPGTFAQKCNLGYRTTNEPWLFLVGDDVRFRPGWLGLAQGVAGNNYHVVGTNDLGNPRVTSGEHATHLLVRRSYVDNQGASWDGPGVVCHEGYRHWYVDDEIVNAAKQRGVWSPSLNSVVEHLHPLFGKGESDATYRLGQKSAGQDKALFEKRRAEHA